MILTGRTLPDVFSVPRSFLVTDGRQGRHSWLQISIDHLESPRRRISYYVRSRAIHHPLNTRCSTNNLHQPTQPTDQHQTPHITSPPQHPPHSSRARQDDTKPPHHSHRSTVTVILLHNITTPHHTSTYQPTNTKHNQSTTSKTQIAPPPHTCSQHSDCPSCLPDWSRKGGAGSLIPHPPSEKSLIELKMEWWRCVRV